MELPSEPYNLASALQKEAKFNEEHSSVIDWDNLKYAEIEAKLANAPSSQLEDYCSKNPRRCEETIRKRRIREFGGDGIEEAYVNPIYNYWAAQVRHYLRKAQEEQNLIDREYPEFSKIPSENFVKSHYNSERRKAILRHLEELRKEQGLDRMIDLFKPENGNNTVAQLLYALNRPNELRKKAHQISLKLLEYLKNSSAQPKTIQVYSSNLGFNWFPRGAALKRFNISPAQERELREKLVTLGLEVDDWAEIFDLEGGRSFYFMSEFEIGNFLPHRGRPQTFNYFLDKLGLTEDTYKLWQ